MLFGLSNPELGVVMLVLFIVFIMLGFPIAFTLMALGVGFGYWAMGDTVFSLVVQRTYSVMANDVLVSIPLFIFMGYIIERANILDRLFHSIQLSLGNVPGSLAIATLATCAIFATATGIVGAVVTLMGLLAFPAMLRAGYDVKLSAGVVCAGGCLGILIPPSVMLILYGATAGVSVPKLYAGALFPGLLLAGLYMLYVLIRCWLNPALAPKLPKEQTDVPWTRVLWALLTSFFPLTILIMSVLGCIFFGLATPTEAAAVGSLGSLILAAAYRSLTFGKVKDSVILTARTSAMVCWLFVGSFIFSSIFAILGGHEPIKNLVTAMNLSPTMFLIVAQLIIFVLGWPLEWTEIIVIFVPIFLPLLEFFKIDPLFFGILIALNIQTSFLSPPVAMAPFYLKGIAPPHVSINQIFAGVMPYLAIVVFAMILVYVFPGIALWLPKYLYG
ncbi:TRAP transporter, DctM subunit [Bosea sp. 62]|uniref:TRAP transporter large permease n=1 Tax=unclassified Bosea (in: a-proteobacteria) TaxID=2653178 RepID=UPI001252894F|nr:MULTISPECIES: TRAP transporter large permease subunit [unclassified Bosea (in: a-proteobacteria)]CAD5251880.1 TRAP transporter, DctM subunit [Bosea sp. 7B]CAD5279811.1 TRAP transporter, DctM subunit [Bosea sp. 21B]CAD5280927.1 TRAP transporter, DctM subunit [Bosea sp. 46]VVT59498.1 TRAP transporter, DctM subunit [Bosea sp. EC-HK365B]VXB31447.1 TRAP transporter, DctM subunit [Bosea sp. 62]